MPAPSIRTVDFLNRTYQHGSWVLAVKDGEASFQFDPETPEPMGSFSVAQPVYGDVTGDGVEEAIVVTMFSPSGMGYSDAAEVYAMRPGLVLLGTIEGGDRGDGGIEDVTIEDGAIRLERGLLVEGDAMCCPSQQRRELWRWKGGRFVEDVSARAIVDQPR